MIGKVNSHFTFNETEIGRNIVQIIICSRNSAILWCAIKAKDIHEHNTRQQSMEIKWKRLAFEITSQWLRVSIWFVLLVRRPDAIRNRADILYGSSKWLHWKMEGASEWGRVAELVNRWLEYLHCLYTTNTTRKIIEGKQTDSQIEWICKYLSHAIHREMLSRRLIAGNYPIPNIHKPSKLHRSNAHFIKSAQTAQTYHMNKTKVISVQ